jgi:hypothetical protein
METQHMSPETELGLRERRLEHLLNTAVKSCTTAASVQPFVTFAVRSIKQMPGADERLARRLQEYPTLHRVLALTERWLAGADVGDGFHDLFEEVVPEVNAAGRAGRVIFSLCEAMHEFTRTAERGGDLGPVQWRKAAACANVAAIAARHAASDNGTTPEAMIF